MKFLAILLATAGLVAAQDLSSLPSCATTCVGSSVNVPGCNSLDIKCICSNKDYLNNIACCLSTGCSAADQKKAVAFAQNLCKSAGVTVPDSVVCSSASQGSSMTMTATATGSAAAAASSATKSAASVASSVAASLSSVAASVSASAASVASSATATAASNAAQAVTGRFGVAGAVVAAVALL